jgi:hypothetical protein
MSFHDDATKYVLLCCVMFENIIQLCLLFVHQQKVENSNLNLTQKHHENTQKHYKTRLYQI